MIRLPAPAIRRSLALLVVVLVSAPCPAQQPANPEADPAAESDGAPAGSDALEGILDEFQEPAPAIEPKAGPKATEAEAAPRFPAWLDVGGSLGLAGAYNYAHDAPKPGRTDHRGLSSLRARLDLDVDIRLAPGWGGHASAHGFYDWAYAIHGRGEFTQAFRDQMQQEVEVEEAYIRGSLRSDLDLEVGRQIVVWGKSDNIRVTDILNPLDVREPGRTDIEDLRLPVTMTKLDYYFGDWNLSGIVMHERRFNLTPAYGSDFFNGPAPLPHEDELDWGLGNQEYGVALRGTFPGWDLSFFGAYVFDNNAHAEATAFGQRRAHSRLTMAGVATDVALGNWLLKGEVAFLRGFEFLAAPGGRKSRLDVLVGFEYSGFQDSTISLELANRHLFGFDSSLAGRPDDGRRNDFETALRVTRTFLNETLELTALASTHGVTGGNGGFQRLELTYDWTDDVEVTAGMINYVSGDKLRFTDAGDNDRVYFEIKYQF